MPVRKIKSAKDGSEKFSWWVDFCYKGERMRQRSLTNTKEAAKVLERKLYTAVMEHGSITKALSALNTKHTEQKTSITFTEFADRWLTDYVDVNNKPSEQRAKRFALRLHLIPEFGALPLAEITSHRIDQLKAKLQGKKLCHKSINNYLTILRKCLTTAFEWGQLATVPRIKLLKSLSPKFRYLDQQEVSKLLAASSGMLRTIILVAVRTGLRACELLALQWDDIDFQSGKICVRRSIVREQIGTPKNGRMRFVPMTSEVVKALQELPHDGLFIFQNQGMSLRYERVLEQVHAVSDRAGVRSFGMHVFRHSFASDLARLGVSLQVIKELLGHATIEMTLKYSHLGPDTLRNAVALLEPKPESRQLAVN